VDGAVAEEAAFGAAVSPLHGVHRDVWEGARAREWEAWAEREGRRAGLAGLAVEGRAGRAGPRCRWRPAAAQGASTSPLGSLEHCRIRC
jgi:hypothetical protein